MSAFVDRMGVALAELSGKSAEHHRADATVEAADLVAAILDADGRFTDAELDAYLAGVGEQLDPPLFVTTQRLREGRSLVGRSDWLARPSTLFDILVLADRRDGEHAAHGYYTLALQLAHAVAAVDLLPSADEIAAIDRFRSMMLATMDAAGVARPGVPRRGTAGPARTTPAGAPSRSATTAPEQPPDMPAAEPIEVPLAELDALVGLEAVKREVRRLTSLLQVQQLRTERGLPVIEISHHLVFTGNPGTGKTTVARLLSRIYRSLTVLSSGHLVETDRSGLVAGYVGQTATKTKAVLEQALGGTLLIDEAYALARGGEQDFGREAIDTIVKFMEDHRDDLAVVAAGYPDEMMMFISTNPGLQSRFGRTVHFADYTTDELVQIFVRLGERHEYHAGDDAIEALRLVIEAQPRDQGFGNARFVRNVFEAAVTKQAMRVAPLSDPSTEQLTTLTVADIVG